MESKKYNKLVNKTKKKQTRRYREQTSGYRWGGFFLTLNFLYKDYRENFHSGFRNSGAFPEQLM